MRYLTALAIAALVSAVNGAAVNLHKRTTLLDVLLTPAGNSAVTAAITNNGDQTLNLLNKGTILDEDDSQKLGVMQAGKWVPFEGALFTIDPERLPESAFTEISPGQTITVELDAAELHDLSPGGDYDLVARGAIPYAESGSFVLTGNAVPFQSNVLTVPVNGSLAAKARRGLFKRTKVQNAGCNDTQLEFIAEAHAGCAAVAAKAAAAASNGTTSKLNEYFKSNSASTRNLVSARLKAIASECSSLTSGATTTTCEDANKYCKEGVLAYAYQSTNAVTYCPLWFNALKSLTTKCHKQDRATTALHELTHTPGVYAPGTDDLAYGYAAATNLTAEQALMNADSYALFANAIWSGGDC